MKIKLIGIAACIILLLLGCAQSVHQPKLQYTKYVGPNRTLVLLLPTIAGNGAHFEEHGFIEAVRERGFEVDMKILDIRPVLYLNDRIVGLIQTELVEPAKVSGYQKIILVGISLGGHGALLYTVSSPRDVDGVVVLAPFLGGFFIDKAIEEAGGLHRWQECPAFEWPYACEMWHLLKTHLSHPENRQRIIVGYGTQDGFAERNQLLADQLPPGNVFTVDGGHDWMTWKLLWTRVLDYFHVSCGEPGHTTCLIEIEKVTY